jgi:hypothetical protein
MMALGSGLAAGDAPDESSEEAPSGRRPDTCVARLGVIKYFALTFSETSRGDAVKSSLRGGSKTSPNGVRALEDVDFSTMRGWIVERREQPEPMA